MAGSPFGKPAGTATKGKATTNAAASFDAVAGSGENATTKQVTAGDPFSLASAASGLSMQQLVGRLVLATPTEDIDSMPTQNGDTDAIRADFVILDGEADDPELAPGTKHDDVLVFQTVLKRVLRKTMSGPNPMVLGRIVMGSAQKGKNAPYLFEEPDAEDVELARQYLASIAE